MLLYLAYINELLRSFKSLLLEVKRLLEVLIIVTVVAGTLWELLRRIFGAG
jgi:hypothetical protein